MTKTQELLEAVRAAHDGATDYKLAQLLDVPRTTMHEMIRGTREADAYAATRIALVLNKDPLEVIASIEAENASTEAKRAFWRSFPSGLRRTAISGAVLLATSGFFPPGQTGTDGPGTSSHNVRLRQRPERRKAPNAGLFFDERRASRERDRRRPGRPA